jgi:hypothetical protein
MAVNEIVGTSILVLIFSLAGVMIVNMFLGFGTTRTELRIEPPASEEENVPEEDATPTPANDDTEASSEIITLQREETEKEYTEAENNWRCACEGGFLPPGMLKSFGGAEAVMRLGTGQCYHKQGT